MDACVCGWRGAYGGSRTGTDDGAINAILRLCEDLLSTHWMIDQWWSNRWMFHALQMMIIDTHA
jgi:hypothetical protein